MDCARNIITANFSGGKTHATTARVYQWSRGIELCITGADNLPQTFKAHFSVQKRGGVATTIVGIDERVDVPNVLFTIGKDIHVWLGASETEDDAEILYTVDIPVAPAPMPEYYDAEDTGVFDSVVEQVADYAATATAAANSAGASATAAAGSASAAAASASSAAESAGAAEQARADAVTAKGQAETAAQTATEKAQQSAQNASQAASDAGRAESAAERAETAETGAGAAKTAAEAAAQGAAASASAASASATSAGQSASAAAQSASAAAQSAASIEGDVQTATQKANEATTAAGQAVTAKDAAVTAQTAAETAATNAGQSASTATAKAAEAATSASGAAQSKTDAEAAAARAEQAAATLTVDTALSDTSTNPVQNKVVTAELTDVKSAIDALKITDTASGAIASFPDGAAMPVESLTVDLEPIQDLHGQDAPYPAGGGANLFDKESAINGYYISNSNGNEVSSSGAVATDFIPVNPSTSYYIINDANSGLWGAWYDANKVFIRGITGKGVVTSPDGAAYMRYTVKNVDASSGSIDTFAINYPSTATSYAPYSNICPITGRNSVTVVRTGINVWDEEWELGTFNANGEPVASNNNVRTKNFISVKPSTAYYFRVPSVGITAFYYDADKTCIGVFAVSSSQVKTTDANAIFMRFRTGALTTYNHDISINYPSTDHDYHPGTVQSATIQLGQTVYGGTLDVVNGKLTVDRAYFEMQTAKTSDWQKSSSYPGGFYIGRNAFKIDGIALKDNTPFLCSHAKSVSRLADYVYGTCYCDSSLNFRLMDGSATLSDWVAYLQEQKNNGTPVVACGLLATPLTIQLTPAQLSTLKGQNNVWSDADSVTVEYVADPKLYISRLTEPDADMVADANITSGSYFMVGNNLYLATANIASGATIVPGVNCTRTNLAAALNAINS